MSRTKIETPFGIDIPRRVHCAAMTYRIEDYTFDSDGQLGDCCALTQRIRIAIERHASKEQLLSTFLHEVGHAINQEYGITREEPEVDRLAQGYTQAIMDLLAVQ